MFKSISSSYSWFSNHIRRCYPIRFLHYFYYKSKNPYLFFFFKMHFTPFIILNLIFFRHIFGLTVTFFKFLLIKNSWEKKIMFNKKYLLHCFRKIMKNIIWETAFSFEHIKWFSINNGHFLIKHFYNHASTILCICLISCMFWSQK